MSFMNGNSFADRQAAAAKARKEMAEKFLANSKYDPADPTIVEREAKRKEIMASVGSRGWPTCATRRRTAGIVP